MSIVGDELVERNEKGTESIAPRGGGFAAFRWMLKDNRIMPGKGMGNDD